MRKAMGSVAALGLVTAILGCDPDELPRSDVTILSVNGNEALQSDVLNHGEDDTPNTEDDFIPEDEIFIRFSNVPSDAQGVNTAVGAFSDVTIETYRISFSAVDPTGASVAIDPVVGGMHAVVRSNNFVDIAIVAVPAALKIRPPISGLLGAAGEIVGTAHLEFWGTEKTSNDDIYVDAYLVVNFADFGDDD
jgi:hypothetical protein